MTSASNSFATGSGSGLVSAASEKGQSISARHVTISAGGISGKEYVTAAMAPATDGRMGSQNWHFVCCRG
jgi:hypothetical protein